jgi:hypothetical protein
VEPADPEADTAPICVRDGDGLTVHLAKPPAGCVRTYYGYEDTLYQVLYLEIPGGRYVKMSPEIVDSLGGPDNALTVLAITGDDAIWFDETGTPIPPLEVR